MSFPEFILFNTGCPAERDIPCLHKGLAKTNQRMGDDHEQGSVGDCGEDG